MKNIKVRVKRLPHSEDLEAPVYMSEGASGMDLRAAIQEPVLIHPGKWKIIPAGIVVSIPQGFEAQIRPRSGLAMKFGVTLLNSPGTIDADYRGEISLILINLGEEPFRVERGMRLGQMIFAEVAKADLEFEDELDVTVRGQGGFGHTGI